MCGIVGYVGNKRVVPVIIDGLKRLEYRGYDSAGIAVCGNGEGLQIRRAEGKLRNLEGELCCAEEEAHRRGPPLHHRDRHRGHRTPRRKILPEERERTSSFIGRSGAQGRRPAHRRLRPGGDRCRRT